MWSTCESQCKSCWQLAQRYFCRNARRMYSRFERARGRGAADRSTLLHRSMSVRPKPSQKEQKEYDRSRATQSNQTKAD